MEEKNDLKKDRKVKELEANKKKIDKESEKKSRRSTTELWNRETKKEITKPSDNIKITREILRLNKRWNETNSGKKKGMMGRQGR